MAETALDLTLESVDSGSWHTERTLALVPEPTIEAPTMCDLAAGTRLHDSRLRVLERISDGACGVVYRGEHIDLRRPLAIKVLRGDMMGEGAREQFLDEARITGSISSPHVVQVVDFGELPDGRVWYAMELLGGRALDQVIAGGPIEASRAIDLLRMACKGLAAGHAAGFVHRDVKPQNLVLVERGGREHLVVVDFGIAVPIGTKPDSICGTPEYMAREQIIRDPLDPRTDVYALGCCAYELLTGKSLVGVCTLGQALLKHDLGIEPKFPAEANVPEALQAIVRRCLAVDPAQRYADMAELEAALCEAQIDLGAGRSREDLELPPIDAVRRGRIADGYAALAKPRRPKRPSSALVWSCASAVVIAVLGAWPQEPAAKDAGTRRAPPVAAGLAAIAPMEPPVEPPMIAAQVRTDIAALPAGEPNLDAALDAEDEAPVHASGTVAPTSAPTERRASKAVARRSASDDVTASSRDLVRDGRRALRRGDRDAALAAFHRALEKGGAGAAAAAGLADAYFDRGEHDRALQFARLAVQRDPNARAHHLRLGDAYYRLARYREARASWEEADRLGSFTAGRRIASLDRGP
jgi:tetratricopeptide (TPR) repeat protein